MDQVFLDRLRAKVKQHLAKRVPPDSKYGLRVYVDMYLDHNGKLVNVCLSLLQRYWERARPMDVDQEAAAHEKLLLGCHVPGNGTPNGPT
jgi:hypothetical protein